MYKAYKADSIIIEDKASGQSLIQEMHKQQIPVVPYRPDRDKISRAHAAVPFFETGLVWMPDQPWVHDLTAEALQFPFGTYDDQVDAMTQAILWLRDRFQIAHGEYNHDDDEDEDEQRDYRFKPRGGRRTYWNAVNPR